jgi:hypothetical protein
MSKIVKAINVMVSNERAISNVIKGYESSELFFMYDNKHKWSIIKNDGGEYFLHYYPGDQELEILAGWPDVAWREFSEMVSYNSNDLGTKEAISSLSELYTVVQEKLYGMDKALDDIIGDDSF